MAKKKKFKRKIKYIHGDIDLSIDERFTDISNIEIEFEKYNQDGKRNKIQVR